jgi:hypothetical protein
MWLSRKGPIGVDVEWCGVGVGVGVVLRLCYYCVQVNEARNDNDGTRPPKQECGEKEARAEGAYP